MDFLKVIKSSFCKGVWEIYNVKVDESDVLINDTRKGFSGSYTIVLFPYIKRVSSSLPEMGESLGKYLEEHVKSIAGYNLVKGFLNLEMSDDFWISQLYSIKDTQFFGEHEKRRQKVLVEYSSPNTNKPLHLGHIRNILLGWSVSRILKADGYDVVKTQIINDRGIAICKSMLAWNMYGNDATPESENMKSDHLVGKFYVLFETKFREEYKIWQESDDAERIWSNQKKDSESKEIFFQRYKNEYFNNYSSLGSKAKELLIKWEAKDEATIALWRKMNNWCYDGFNATYDRLGVDFDLVYYESETYLLGKSTVEKGLGAGLFYQKEDESIWVDLEGVGLDQKILLRSDGTSVYMTQDLGTAQKRYEDHGCEKMIYVVGDEQEYHFKVLFEILKKVGESYADGLFHLSYGMVDLPTGKMKSREGTVVDADDLIDDVIREAKESAEERGDLASLSSVERMEIFQKIGLGALKFFILKVDPKKRMVFNPKDSVDMQGQTGPYIQNAFVRIQSIMRKLGDSIVDLSAEEYLPEKVEKQIVQKLMSYPNEIRLASLAYDPSKIANYAYELAKMFHKFYHDLRILTASTDEAKKFRLDLCTVTARVLEHSLYLLGIDMPDRM